MNKFNILDILNILNYTYIYTYTYIASQVMLVVTNLPDNEGDIRDSGLIPESGRPPGGGHGNQSSILAWRTPWTDEPVRLQSTGLQRVGHD